MRLFIKYSTFLILIFFGLSACQALKDGLEGNKKSKSAEEFLIKKKNPLVLPPDYSKLPLPGNSKEQQESEQDFNLKKILEKNPSSENTNKQTQNNSTFKKSIIEKINKN